MTDDAQRTPTVTRRRLLATTGIALAAGVAGCQGDGDEETTTGGTETPEPLSLPDGTSESGIEDPSTLAEATETALVESDYDVTYRYRQSDLEIEQSAASSIDDERRLFVFDSNNETNRVFVMDGTIYIKAEQDGEPFYDIRPMEDPFETRHQRTLTGGREEGLPSILIDGNYAPAGTVRKNGRRVRRFTLESAQFAESDVEVTNADGAVLVDADSVIHDAALHLDYEVDGETKPLDRAFTIETLGSLDIEEPDWTDTAREKGE